jgi:hypothetical protein
MPSTSSANKSNNQRNSSSTSYNDISQIPRQILPMSRPTTAQIYQQQPQIIVPTQCGFGDMSNLSNSKEMSSTVPLSMDYYDANCFGQVQHYPTYYQQQQQQIYSQQLQQQYFQLQQQQQHNQMIQQTSRVIPRTLSSINQQQQQQHSAPMNHSMTPSHVVPTQTLNVQPLIPLESMSQDVSQSISDYSMSDLAPIDFSLDHPPTICYEESGDKKSCSKNSVLNDVFFSDPMMDDDTEVVLHFDSDSSSDTDILTPRQRYSPPLSPIDLMSGEDLIWNIIYEKTFDLSKDNKPSTDSLSTNMSEIAISSSSSSSSESDVNNSVSSEVPSSSTITTIPPPSMNVSVTPSSNSTSNVTTIDPNLICSNTTIPETIDPRFIETTSSTSVAQNVVVKRLTPVITRPSHIEIGDGIPSPPLKTPELVSDHSIKRRLSCESSSDDDISDAESNDKRAQKKFRVDNKKSIKINDDKRNDVEEEEESDSEEFSSVNDNDEDMDSANEVHDISDTVTDEYHYSSDTESEEDDDEEYRPTNNNKKSRSTRKVAKTQGKARGALSKGSLKTKSGSTKNKSSTKRGKQSSKTSKPSSKRSSGVNTPASLPDDSPPQCFATPVEESQEMEGLEVTSPRPTQSPTIFQTLTKSGIDWCRYCGTTEGVNWRPGPWGKRTLCNKHGCDYKGYGFACKLPRLDLTGFVNESVEDRDRPVLQLFCTVCQKQESYMSNVLVRCEGCFKAYHQKCFSPQITDETVSNSGQWFCESGCSDNVRRKRIVVELPRKKLPLMSTPKVQVPVPNIETGTVPSGTASRPRTSRNSSRV